MTDDNRSKRKEEEYFHYHSINLNLNDTNRNNQQTEYCNIILSMKNFKKTKHLMILCYLCIVITRIKSIESVFFIRIRKKKSEKELIKNNCMNNLII